MTREIRFDYVYHHKKDGDYQHEQFTLLDIEYGRAKEHQDCMSMDGYKLVARRQYTGLKDRNGKEIYEGDILRGCFKDENRLTAVEWSEQWACWVVTYKGYGLSTFQDIEVIGNIYSNPELLEGQHG